MKRRLMTILAILGGVLFLSILKIQSIFATTENGIFQGYSNDAFSNAELEVKTNTKNFTSNDYETMTFTYQETEERVSNKEPLLTILTHGFELNASAWSNNYEYLASNKASFEFSFDSESIIERLRTITNGNVYKAEMISENQFKLFPLPNLKEQETIIKNLFNTQGFVTEEQANSLIYINDDSPTVTKLGDISKHTIIVFEAKSTSGSNNAVYQELNYMIDKLAYDIKCLNGGQLPKINLISHSRGGLTNLEYAMNHPNLVDSIYTLAAPFLGSNFGESELLLQAVNLDKNNPGIQDLLNEDVFLRYRDRWNIYYQDLYSSINFHAIGGYSSIDFINYMLIKDPHASGFWGALGTAFLTLNNMFRMNINLFNLFITVIGWTDFDDQGLNEACRILADSIYYENFGDLLLGRYSMSDDLMVHLDSQLAEGYTGITRLKKKFKSYNTNLKKISQNQIAGVHNLESRDSELINYILSDIKCEGAITNAFLTEELQDGTLKITGAFKPAYTGDTLIIPSTLNQKTVTEIGDFAFSNMFTDAQIKKVEVGTTIKRIGNSAFSNNSTIETIRFDANSRLTEIGEAAFSDCTALLQINLPNGVTTLKDFAFSNCRSMTNFVIPSNFSSFGKGVFEGCIQLQSFILNENNPEYTVEEGVLFNKEKTTVYHYPPGKTTAYYTLPAKTVNIYLDSFVGNTFLKEIDLNNARVVRENAFLGCINLSNIIGIKVESVYENAFSETQWLENQSDFAILGKCLVAYKGLNKDLKASDFPSEVKSFGSDSFRNSEINSIVIPKAITEINSKAFDYSLNLRHVYLLGEPYLYNYVFRNLNLASIHVTKDFYPNSKLDPYRAFVEQIKTNVTIIDVENSTNLEFYYGEAYELPTTSQTGYTKNWYDETNQYYANSGSWNSLKENITLTAREDENVRWTLNENEVFTYNLLPGDTYKFTKEGIYINSELKYTLPINSLYYEYKFYANNYLISEGIYDGSFKIVNIKEEPINYNVIVFNYDPNDPSLSNISSINCTKLLSQIAKSEPEKYVFEGFYTDSNYTNKITSVLQILALTDKIIYAKWNVVYYDVYLNYNNGTTNEKLSVSALNNTIILPYKTKLHYSYGYYSDGNLLKINFNEEINITENLTLYIVWIPQDYSITYYNVDNVSNNPNLKYYNIESPNFYIQSISRDKYNFKGWFKDKNFSNPVNIISQGTTGDIKIYAKWELNVTGTRTTSKTITDAGFLKNPYDIINLLSLTNYSVSSLKAQGYLTLQISISLRVWEIADGYQHIAIYNGYGSNYRQLWTYKFEHGPGSKNTTPQVYTFNTTININDLTDALYILYDASGSFSDDWGNDSLRVTINSLQNSFQSCDGTNHFYTDSYQQYSKKQHLAYCSCGKSILQGHAIKESSNINQFVNCVYCKELLDLNVDGPVLVIPSSLSVYSNVFDRLEHKFYYMNKNELDAYLKGEFNLSV